MRCAYIGFDSAWSGKAPGGLCYAILDSGSLCDFATPILATFDDAKCVIERCREDTDYTLVAIDQPTMVPNHTGMRPVERVAGSIQPGVQPANLNSSMFNRAAPIWAFLDDLDAREEPLEAQRATQGLHLIEVFPGLALRGLLPIPPKTLQCNPKGPVSRSTIGVQSQSAHRRTPRNWDCWRSPVGRRNSRTSQYQVRLTKIASTL